ncbi:hypothetical protein ES702_00775 [subsurface metagenome]
MDCEKCPVKEICHSEKGESSLQFREEIREGFRKSMHSFCPLEMAVTINISGLSHEFAKYLQGKRRFEKKKGE